MSNDLEQELEQLHSERNALKFALEHSGRYRAVCVAMYAALCRGKLDVNTNDPETMALYLGASQMLNELMKPAEQENRE